jgi:hypothetical protein
MPPHQSDIYEASRSGGALRHCEILSTIVQPRPRFDEQQQEFVIDLLTHPLVVVFSQDCDLDLDLKTRRERGDGTLPNVLFCELVTAAELRGDKKMNSTLWSQISKNVHPRYQFLERVLPEKDAEAQGLPELGIDFKRHFTIPTAEVYRQLGGSVKRRCKLVGPFALHLSSRFFYFLSRIALPTPHASEPS